MDPRVSVVFWNFLGHSFKESFRLGLSVSAWVSKHGVWMQTLGGSYWTEPDHHVSEIWVLGYAPSCGHFKRENEVLIDWRLGIPHCETNPLEVPTWKFYVLKELWAFCGGNTLQNMTLYGTVSTVPPFNVKSRNPWNLEGFLVWE